MSQVLNIRSNILCIKLFSEKKAGNHFVGREVVMFRFRCAVELLITLRILQI